MKRITLYTIVLSLAVGLGVVGCDKKPNENNRPAYEDSQQTQQRYSTKNINGKIEAIDEDSFAILARDKWSGAGVGNFQYEIFRVQDENGMLHKLIMPSPSSYAVGDTFSGEYRALGENGISFSDLFDEFGYVTCNGYPLQRGKIDAEGIILR